VIAETGYNPSRLSILMNHNALFRAKVAQIQREIEERLIDRATTFGEQVDLMVPDALATVEELNMFAEQEGVRLGAAKDILDRAPSAPKVVKRQESKVEGVVVQIGLQALEGMKKAMRDIGEDGVVDLIEKEGGYE
jgi:hypothetical protein